MKKITLFLLLFTVVTLLNAQTQRKWQGGQPVKVWDYATSNWLDPAFPFPLPTTFSEGSDAIFDDTILNESDTLKISGAINAGNVTVNSTKRYVMRRTADTDSVYGTGTLTKDGTGLLVMDFKSGMQGGTILKAGTMKMEKQTTPNIWGSKILFQGGTANFATTTASTYPSVTVPIEIPAGITANVELSRYSYWSSKLSGSGDLHIFAGGERTYLGQKNVQPDWSAFTGNVKVDKCIVAGVTPGHYGIMLNTNKTFLDSLNGFKIDSTFYNRKLTLGAGTCLTSESGVRSYSIGELSSEDSTSIIAGYYKESTTPLIRYFVGGLNTDVEIKARIGEIPGVKKGYNKVGIIKVGRGTYRFTHHNNNFIGGLVVREGKVLIDDEVKKGNFRGGLSIGTSGTAKVETQGAIGGKGRIQANLDIWGRLEPGSNGVGTLLVRDTMSVVEGGMGGIRRFGVTLQPGSVTEFEIQSVNAYDKLKLSGVLRFNNDANLVLPNPVIKIKALPGAEIKEGDWFDIITADTVYANNAEYSIQYPEIQNITWQKYTQLVLDNPRVYKISVIARGPSAVKNIAMNNVSVYPNPVVGNALFTCKDGLMKSVEIINLQGQIMKTVDVNAAEINLSVGELNSGLYYARINTSRGQEIHKLIIR